MQVSGGAVVENLREVTAETVHDGLGLGVAHADVELEGFGAVGSHHQAGVEEAGEGGSFFSHAFDGRAHDGFHDGSGLVGREDAFVDVGAHAPGVWALVVVEDVLVVLGREEGQDGGAIGKGDEADLFSDEEFFDDQALAGGADEFSRHELLDGGAGFRHRLGDDDSFPGGEAVSFEDDGCFVFFEGFQGVGFVGRGVEPRSGDVVTCEEILGEDLAAFQLCGGLDGAEDGAAGLAELVDDAIDERGFGADDG